MTARGLGAPLDRVYLVAGAAHEHAVRGGHVHPIREEHRQALSGGPAPRVGFLLLALLLRLDGAQSSPDAYGLVPVWARRVRGLCPGDRTPDLYGFSE